MTAESKHTIVKLLKEEWDHYQTEVKFLEHQRTLPPEHRKVELDDSEVGIFIFDLDLKCSQLQKAIEEVNKLPTT